MNDKELFDRTHQLLYLAFEKLWLPTHGLGFDKQTEYNRFIDFLGVDRGDPNDYNPYNLGGN